MKQLSAILSLILCICLLAGCAGTPVVYHIDCDCPTQAAPEVTQPAVPDETPPVEGAVKTGLAIVTHAKDSFDATAEKDGEAKYDVTIAAVLVDENGTILDCIIDGVASSVKFDAEGVITSDLAAALQTKNELGENYGMVKYGGAVAEWDAQVAALAQFAIGKNTHELRSGAIDESGKAPAGSDLSTSATIYLGGYVSAIEQAVAQAQYLGAQAGDQLRMAAITGIDGSKSVSGGEDGTAQLDVTATALTLKSGTITSCAIDSVQAKVGFSGSGAITSGTSGLIPTKNELGEQYGMVAWGGAIAEWDAQAAAFAAYVTGMKPEQVGTIAVNERTVPTEADLVSSVTIAIGGFQALIQKAAQ